MGEKGYKAIKFVMKLVSVFVAGIMISMVIMTNIDTYSWFTSSFNTNISVNAASTEDILGIYEIVTDDKGNATGIRLQKNGGCAQNLVIYFSLEGEAANYISHINPIKLEDYEEHIIQIKVNPNTASCIKLASTMTAKDDALIQGNIRIKYLNEYIDEEQTIQFTKQYILDSYNKDVQGDVAKRQNRILRVQMDNTESEEYKNYINELINYAASQRSWEEAEWTMEDITMSEDINTVTNTISEVNLHEDQKSLIDIIVPKLREYIDALYNTIQDLVSQLNEKLAYIEELTQKLLELENEKYDLITENEDLKVKLSIMEEELNKLPIYNTPVINPPTDGSSGSSEDPNPSDDENNGETPEDPIEEQPDEDEQQTEDPEEEPIDENPIEDPLPDEDGQETEDPEEEPIDENPIEDPLPDEDEQQTEDPTEEPSDEDSQEGNEPSDEEGEDPSHEDGQPEEEPEDPVSEDGDSSDPGSDEDADDTGTDETNDETPANEEEPDDNNQPGPMESTEPNKQQEPNPQNIDVIDKLSDDDTNNKKEEGTSDDDDNQYDSEEDKEQEEEPSSQVIRDIALSLTKYNK